MNKEFENPVPPRTKGEAGRIIEDKAAEARERIGRIEKAASGAAAEAQAAAQDIEEGRAEREIAERDIVQRRGKDEKIEASALPDEKRAAEEEKARKATARGKARVEGPERTS